MKINKLDTHTDTLKLKAENNRDLKFLLRALVAEKINVENWRGWIDVNGAKIRFNPKTLSVYYAAKVEDNTNPYLFDHLAYTLAKYCHVRKDKVSVDNKFGKDLDIYMGGSTKYYCAQFKLTEQEAKKTASEYFKTPDHFMKLISHINSQLKEAEQ